MGIVKDIYCFHVNLGRPDLNETVGFWSEVWSRHGWTPHILGMADAQRHPKYTALLEHVGTLPTVNGRQFENANYLRWCAFAQVAGAVADYDVLPRVKAFPPQDFPDFFCGDPEGGPGFIVGGPAHFEQIIDWVLNTKADGTNHISDMHIIRDRLRAVAAIGNLVKCYGVPGWRDLPLTHFGNGYMKTKLPKAQEMQNVLWTEGAL